MDGQTLGVSETRKHCQHRTNPDLPHQFQPSALDCMIVLRACCIPLPYSVPGATSMESIRPVALQREQGDAYWVFGELYTFKVTAAETGGELAVIETVTSPQNGPPLHTHSREDESFYILEGRFLFTIGDQIQEVGPGGFLFAPRGIQHGYRNISALPARKIVVVTPGGFESFLREIGERATQTIAPPPHRSGTIEKAMELSQKYGLRIQIPDGLAIG